jgi:hypothetical protein
MHWHFRAGTGPLHTTEAQRGRLIADLLSIAQCLQAKCACRQSGHACQHVRPTSTKCMSPCFALIWLQTNSWLYQALEAEEAAVQQGTQVR